MKTKKGDLWKCSNPEFRGLTDTFYYYCVMGDDSAYMMARVIITQKGDILIDKSKIEEFDDKKFDYFDLVQTSIQDFLKNKDDFKKNNSLVSFKHKKYDHGIVRKVDTDKRTLKIEVVDDETSEEKEIKFYLIFLT